MTTKTVGRCGIYEERPQMCRDYPKVESWIPPECTFYFAGEERKGTCACDIGACCAATRANGDPEGEPLPAIDGGLPCKHLEYHEVPMEKDAEELTKLSYPEDGRGYLLKEAVEGD